MTSSRISKHNRCDFSVALACLVLTCTLYRLPCAAQDVSSLTKGNFSVSPDEWRQPDFSHVRVVRDFFGTTWVGGDDGLAAFKDGRWRRWSGADGHAVRRVSSFDIDPTTRDLWIGTLGGGLVRFTAGRFDVFDQFNSGLAGDMVFGVAVGQGRVYAATNGGVSEFDPISQTWDLLVPRRSGVPQQVAVHIRVEQGALLAEMWSGGQFRWEPATRQWSEHAASRLSMDRDPAANGTIDNRISTSENQEKPERSHPTIAILGPGTRRIVLPGDTSPANVGATRNQPDIAATRIAVQLARLAKPTSEVMLWQPAPGYSKYAWGLLEDDLVKYADNANVVGLIAHLDDNQPYTAASIDFMQIPAINVALNPIEMGGLAASERWIFQCHEDQPRQIRGLLEFVRRKNNGSWLVVELDTAYETALRTAWTRSYVGRREIHDVRYIAAAEVTPERVRDAVDRERIAILFLWGNLQKASPVLQRLTDANRRIVIVGGSDLIHSPIPDLVRKEGWTVIASASSPSPATCAEALINQYGAQPIASATSGTAGALACRTFYGTEHLIAAIQQGPPERAAIAGTLLHMEQDILGERHFESRHHGEPVQIDILQEGQWRREEITAPPVREDSIP